jgi:hypothetical protein
MQNGSSGTLIGWKSAQTTFVPLWDRMEGAWLWTLACGNWKMKKWRHIVNTFAPWKIQVRQSLCNLQRPGAFQHFLKIVCLQLIKTVFKMDTYRVRLLYLNLMNGSCWYHKFAVKVRMSELLEIFV